jgi:hypothetical protein
MCYGIYGLCVFNATLNISFNSESKSEYGIALNRHNYEVKVSGVCLFVRPYVITLSQFRIIKYHRMPSLQILSSGVLKKCCLYLSRAAAPDIWLVEIFSASSFALLQMKPWDVPETFLSTNCYMNHFSKVWYLLFICPFLSIFYIKGKRSILVYTRLEFEWIYVLGFYTQV